MGLRPQKNGLNLGWEATHIVTQTRHAINLALRHQYLKKEHDHLGMEHEVFPEICADELCHDTMGL